MGLADLATQLTGLVDLATQIADPASLTAEDAPRWQPPVDGLGGPIHGLSIFLFFLFN